MAMDRDPLFDILNGVDEAGTSELINQQLASIASNLEIIKVKMKVDGTGLEEAKNAISGISAELQKAASAKSATGSAGLNFGISLELRKTEPEVLKRLL